MDNPYIKSIKATGIHGQFNIDVELLPGLNVLYGMNGRGKTTLLHLIANVFELEFDRFKYLLFVGIEITLSNGSLLSILPAESAESPVQVELDGNHVAWYDESERGAADRTMLRETLGNRPNYLPAFRSILERVRTDGLNQSLSAQQQPEFERIRITESRVNRHTEIRSSPRYIRADPAAATTALKTVQCRQWFGKFVPIVRYPSIVEVVERLESEFSNAELEVASLERSMFTDFFIGTIKALLNPQGHTTEQEFENLLGRIKAAVDVEEDGYLEYQGEKAVQQLVDAIDSVKTHGTSAGAAEKRVLQLYATILERRNSQRTQIFARIRKFEEAINKFLVDKTLHISETSRTPSERGRLRGIYVESENLHRYALTSLSSGERQVLTMLFSASRMSSSSGIFLVDEPELSLHVDWQRIVLSELIAQAGQRQIIACTHSPEVGADHEAAVQIFTPSPYSAHGPNLHDSDASILDESL